MEKTKSNGGTKYGATSSKGYVIKKDFREDMKHKLGHQR